VAQAYNPSYLGGRNQEYYSSRNSLCKKSARLPFQPIAGCGGTHLWSQLCKRQEVGRSWSEASHGQKQETLPEKINKIKKGVRVWLKRKSTCQQAWGWVQTPVSKKQNKFLPYSNRLIHPGDQDINMWAFEECSKSNTKPILSNYYKILQYGNHFWTHFFFLVGLKFELTALHLRSRHSTTWATPPFHLLSLF
jgi:hypothetical protein